MHNCFYLIFLVSLPPYQIPDFYSSAIGGKTVAKKRMRLSTFPQYLLVQLKKFDVGPDWQPYKLDVEVQMPDQIDLAQLQAKGKQDGEEEMPEDKEVRKGQSGQIGAFSVLKFG